MKFFSENRAIYKKPSKTAAWQLRL